MVWRYACAFYRIVYLCFYFILFYFILFFFFHIFYLDFLHGSEFVVGTLWAQLLLRFYTDPSGTSQVS